MRVTPAVSPETATGTRLCVVGPYPSCPWVSSPQHWAAPEVVTAQVWAAPALIAVVATHAPSQQKSPAAQSVWAVHVVLHALAPHP
jgi:hypothetical protein